MGGRSTAVQRHTKLVLLDTLGVILAGGTA